MRGDLTGRFTTMVEVLAARAEATPDRLIYTMLRDDLAEVGNLTLGGLAERVSRLAAELARRGLAGERVLLLYPTELELVVGFFGCLAAGAVAVPVYPPRAQEPPELLQGILADCSPRCALTSLAFRDRAAALLGSLPPERAPRLEVSEELGQSGAGAGWRMPSPDDLAFLQYTSGSTSSPKGVMVRHRNLLANEEMIRAACDHDEQSHFVTWLPLYHDMGLVGSLLQPLYLGSRCVLMAPSTFVRRPARWLEAVSRYRGCTSGGPNFAFELCAQKVSEEECRDLDLSSWRIAFCGAEPVQAASLERFVQRFTPYGFRRQALLPCYGLAEATLMAAGGGRAPRPVLCAFDASGLERLRALPAAEDDPRARRLVGCGHAVPGAEIVIVDPDQVRACGAGEVGEIWLGGPAVAAGYWNRPELSEQTFEAGLPERPGSSFLRTGDLGFLADGELFVVGRRKDLLIVRGRNHHPQDVERTALAAHPALRPNGAAAFTLEGERGEEACVVVELARGHRGELEGVARAVREAVAGQLDLVLDEVVLIRGSVPRTTSGKVQRGRCRAALLAGELEVLHRSRLLAPVIFAPAAAGAPAGGWLERWRSAPAADRRGLIEALVAAEARAVLRLEAEAGFALDADRPLNEYGLDSLGAVELRDRLAHALGRELPLTLLLEQPTLAALGRFLAAELAPAAAAGGEVPTPAPGELEAGRGAVGPGAEPIAVVGLACRFPGGASDPEAFWQLLAEGRDAIVEVPESRWSQADLYDPEPGVAGKVYIRSGGFLREPVDELDGRFFDLSAAEAAATDPQHRLLLEVAWEALERAGLAGESLAGSACGVFVGISTNDYGTLLGDDLRDLDAFTGTGNAYSAAAGRISYLLDLHGPCLAVDTACSSSLVALHLACQSLRAGECDAALAAGVNLMLSPRATVYSCRIQALSPSGRCRSFAAEADGYTRAEGCGVVVLKRLQQALADGDPILAVVAGSAVNQDGRSAGLTAPNGAAQQAVLASALRRAGREPHEVAYVEAHGSATPLGDPIEARALGAVIGRSRPPGRPLLIGSVKSNLGHLEAAAGVAGLIKTVLAVREGQIPPSLHCERPNPALDLDGLGLRVVDRLTDWPAPARLAGVSSFGFTGTNAHALLAGAPERPGSGPSRPWQLLLLSARSDEALGAASERLARHLDAHPEQDLADVAHTLRVGRRRFEHRRLVVARGHEEASRALAELAGDAVFDLRERATSAPIAFLFPGLGDHYPGMGAQLYRQEAGFRAALDRCAELLRPHCGFDVREELFRGAEADGSAPSLDLRAMLGRGGGAVRGGSLARTAVAQPAIFALEHALAVQLQEWGIQPEAMIGYSLGEYVAATVAGVLSLEEMCRLVAARARLIDELPPGAMLAVPLDAESALTKLAGNLDLAAVNGPGMSVIAGPEEEVAELEGRLAAEGLVTRRLATSHAFHSRAMAGLAGQLTELVAGFTLSRPRIPYLSNVTGDWITAAEATDPGYWARHLAGTVRFSEGLARLLADPGRLMVEVGAGQSLASFVRQQSQQGADRHVFSCLPSAFNRQAEERFLLTTLGRLWLAGAPLDGAAFVAGERRLKVALPTYPFERRRYWLERGPRRTVASADSVPGLARPQRPIWLDAGPVAGGAELSPGPWLVLGEGGELGAALRERLRAAGLMLLEELAPAGPLPSTVVDLRAFGLPDAVVGDPEVAEELLWQSIRLAQNLAAAGAAEPLRWLIVTDGVARVDGEAVRPEKATLVAAARVFPQELPWARLTVCDLEPAVANPAERVEGLLAEAAAEPEPLVAWRAGRRLVPAWTDLAVAERTSPSFRERGVYLITGGLGGLGLALAEHLARSCRARLVLVGRSGLPARGETGRIAMLEALGAEVLALGADVANPADARRMVTAARERFGALHGVFHAAGVPGAGLVLLKTREALAAVLAPKVRGTHHLLEALAGQELDLLVLYSSLTSVAGGLGQVDYCAANAYLDAVALAPAAGIATRVCAIQWGPWEWDAWEELGAIPALRERHQRLRRRIALSFEQGCRGLEQALASGLPQVALATVPVAEIVAEVRGFAVPEAMAAVAGARAVATRTGAPAAPAPHRDLVRRVAALWERVLGRDRVGLEENFFDLGGNSLTGIQLIGELNRELGTHLAPLVLFEAPTVAALARRIQPAESAPAPPAPRPRLGPPAAAPEAAVAIVGMACRFPGASTLEEYWHLLREGRETSTELSEEELRSAGVPAQTLADPAYVRRASVLDDVESFDAALFGFTPREAEILDPQQRLFLECAWEALEQAGYDSQRYPGAIGVFAGSNLSTYLLQLLRDPAVTATANPLQLVLGNEKDALTTMLSYRLGLRGPSVAVQTFCSTSLVAVHMARRSLLGGECDLALAGGVRVAVPHRVGYRYEEGGIEPPDGRCRAFDARGKGAPLGNGAGVVLLKRLSAARADGDPIHAVLLGSAINNDGSLKIGYTAPSVHGQAEAVVAALADAGVDPATIDYVEAHGTGTPLGDPVEIAALNRGFGLAAGEAACWLGSVKTNFGHLDRAAGVAGLIKTALALGHGQIPPTLHFEQANPAIDFAAGPFTVNTELRPWTRAERPRRAAVNSVGMGGTNAHVVVEEAPPAAPPEPSRPYQLLVLSARTEASLEGASARLAEHLEAHPEQPLADVAFTLQQGRRQLERRRAVVAASHAEAVSALSRPESGRLLSGRCDGEPRPVAFLFPGLGEQYPGMAAELHQAEPAFRRALDHCLELLPRPLSEPLRALLLAPRPDRSQAGAPGGLDLRRMLRRDGPATGTELDRTELAQPAIFVVEWSLAQLLLSWGLRPQAMLGYSLGEYVAACVAGVLSLDDALRLVARRAERIAAVEPGAMLAVPRSAEELAPRLGRELSLAAVNGPALSVVAGPSAAIAALRAELEAEGLATSALRTTHAFHSAMLEPLAAELEELARSFPLAAPRVPYLSNVTGTWITADEATDPGYWARHLCRPVLLSAALSELLAEPERVLVEVGPGQTLASLAQQHPSWSADSRRLALSTLPYEYSTEAAPAFLLTSLARAWLAGVEVDWQGVLAEERRCRVHLPTYAFDRRRYWLADGAEVSPAQATAGRKPDPADWFYLPTWKRALPPRAPAAEEGTWLLLADQGGVAAALAAALRRRGARTVLAERGDAFERLDADHYRLRPASDQDLESLLDELGQPPERVALLWPLDAGAVSPGLDPALELGFWSALGLARGLARRFVEGVDLVLFTAGMRSVTGVEALAPAAATLLGPCRVIPQEHPGWRVRSVDLELSRHWEAPAPLSERLVDELLATDGPTDVAYRGADRWVLGYEPVRLEAAEHNPGLVEGGAYLITGGLGGIGLALAEHLAERTRARLCLVGRSVLPPRARWDALLGELEEADPLRRKLVRLRRIEEQGGEVRLIAADVADSAALGVAVAETEAAWGPLAGVIHCAGVTSADSFTPIGALGRAEAELHFGPKVRALEGLAQALSGRSVGFVLLQSSLSAVLGGLGFAAYAGANAYLDAFATERNRRGGPRWLSVDWDTWTTGEAPSIPFGASIARYAMSPSEGLAALERVLALPVGAHLVHSTGDLEARLAEWGSADRSAASGEDSPARAVHGRPQLATPYLEPVGEVERAVAEIWQSVLGIREVGRLDDFFQLGGHSLLATQLFSRLRAAFRVDLPLRSLFERPTVAALSELVEQERGRGTRGTEPSIQPVDRSGELLPSLAQEQLWFLDQLNPGQPVFNEAVLVRCVGALEPAVLRRALNEVLRRHEILRTTFEQRQDRLVQVIHGPRPRALPWVDLRGLDSAVAGAEMERLALIEARRPFDLARGPLLRPALFEAPACEWRLLVGVHHIIHDGWSADRIQREIASLYGAFVQGLPSPLPELSVQYADFAAWERARAAGPRGDEALRFWAAELAGAPTFLALTPDHGTSIQIGPQGGRRDFDLGPEVSRGLAELAAAAEATLFMVLLAAWGVLVHDLSGAEDLLVASSIANRDHLELEPMVGLTANLLPLRVDLRGDPTFRELVARLRQRTLGAYGHADLPFSLLVKHLKPARIPGAHPLVQVHFSYNGELLGGCRAGDLFLEPLPVFNGTAQFVLDLNVTQAGGELHAEVVYATDLFSPAVVEGLVAGLADLLAAVVEAPASRVSELRARLAPRLAGGAAPGAEPRRVVWQAPTPLARRLEAQAASLQASPAAVLLAAWQALLAALSQRPEGGPELPFGALVQSCEADLRRVTEARPCLPVGFRFGSNGRRFGAGPPAYEIVEVDALCDRTDLLLEALLDEAGLRLALCFDGASPAALEAPWLLARLAALLGHGLERPQAPLAELSSLGAAERQRTTVEWNDTGAAWRPLPDLWRPIADNAARWPERIAVVDDEGVWSYGELWRRAEAAAVLLGAAGAAPESLVGVCLERSARLPLALLAVLRSGAAWLPLDPDYPSARLELMIRDAGVSLLIAQPERLPSFDGFAGEVLPIEELERAATGGSAEQLASGPGRDGLAYVIYTSGSTGVPKGVMVPHGAILNRLQWMARAFPLAADDRILQKTPFSFDASIWELFSPLLEGACLVMARPGGHQDPEYLSETVERERITVLQLVPSALRMLLEQGTLEALRGLRRLFAGGEALGADLVERCRASLGVPLINLYGPTETAIDATCRPPGPLGGEAVVPIGRPLDNLQVFLVDRRLQPVPPGMPGELLVGGPSLARGYLRRPGLSAAKLVPNPFGGRPGSRLYCTGDLARHRPDGEIEFLGRGDDQVKIRGFRVELGEVEAALLRHPEVAEAVVTVHGAGTGEARLCGYWVPRRDAGPSPGALRSFLAGSLPEHLVPSFLMPIEALPRLANGKVDRKALPPPSAQRGAEGAGAAPRAGLVADLLAQIWAEVLERPDVDPHQSVFELGAHSLLVTQVVSRLRAAFGIAVPLRLVFDHPTVAGLAERLSHELRGGGQWQEAPLGPLPRGETAPLSFAQQRLWFLHQLDPASGAYSTPVAWWLRGSLWPSALGVAIAALLARHEALRTVIEERHGEAVQRLLPPSRPRVPVVDLSALASPARRAEAEQLVRPDRQPPFDLATGPMLRLTLLRLAAQEHVALVVVHHIASDAWSTAIIGRELAELYRAAVAGRPAALEPLALQYADFALWQRQSLGPERIEAELDFWRRRLAGASFVLELPGDATGPRGLSFRGDLRHRLVPPPLAKSLTALARRSSVSLYMVLLAAFNALIAGLTGRRDLLVGTSIANRDRREIEPLVGFFVNMLVLRTELEGCTTFLDLLARVRETALTAYAHQSLPFDRLVGELAVGRDPSRNPLFQVAFTFENTPAVEIDLPDLVMEPVEIPIDTSIFDLALIMEETPAGLKAAMRFRTDLFSPATIERFLAQLEAIFERVAAQPEVPLAELEAVIRESEKRHRDEQERSLTELAFGRLRSRARAATTTQEN
ncbi:MAG TPA: amino acid adenylation domain-containing protein [Thermoanaerobaculia bacterium]|nr:amino acid adenylation domain-containing protein [Thermoanaerobaculia bacterium]